MKNISWTFALACLGLMILLAAPAAAQANGVRAEIPFAFTVADQTLPAGAYRIDIEKSHSIARIRSEDGKGVWVARLVVGAIDRTGNLDGGRLRFTKHGERYILRDIWKAGSRLSEPVAPSRLPRELSNAGGVRYVTTTR
jgi:hypothetical protein